jgi:hypothetical protein
VEKLDELNVAIIPLQWKLQMRKHALKKVGCVTTWIRHLGM